MILPQTTQTDKELENKPHFDKVPYLLGEIPQRVITAARFVTCCHKKRANSNKFNPYLCFLIFPFVL
jgi:hypothetical protein